MTSKFLLFTIDGHATNTGDLGMGLDSLDGLDSLFNDIRYIDLRRFSDNSIVFRYRAGD
jgi:hypothetical protein